MSECDQESSLLRLALGHWGLLCHGRKDSPVRRLAGVKSAVCICMHFFISVQSACNKWKETGNETLAYCTECV